MEEVTDSALVRYVLLLIAALFCGVLIGAERESKGKPAGISTQTLVIGASATFVFISTQIGAGDSTRIASQIVAGVGFLGAGIILKSEKTHHVSNLTTAASIWFSASIGMALGYSMYLIAIAATLYVMITARLPQINKLNPDDPSNVLPFINKRKAPKKDDE